MGVSANMEMRSSGAAKRTAARREDTPTRGAGLGSLSTLSPRPTGRLLRRNARSPLRGVHGGDTWIVNLQIKSTSCRATDYSRWRGPIRKNIIGHHSGHGMSIRGKQFLARSVFRSSRRPFALLDQPACQHGASVFFDPLIKQSANLLAEIGGMTEARKFVALERIARSREKEFPRGLGSRTGHVGLLVDGCHAR
jgi:hypothetical protein